MKRHNRLLWLVVVLFVGLFCLEAFAGSIGEDREKLGEVNSRIDHIQEEIKKNTYQQKTLVEKIDFLEDSIAKIEREMSRLNGEIEQTQSDIGVTESQLAEAEANIEAKTDVMNRRLRIMYMNKQTGYLEVLLSAEDFEDLLTRLDMVRKIYKHDINLLQFMNEQKELIVVKKQELEAYRRQLVAAKDDKAVKARNLEVSRGQLNREKTALAQDKKELEKAEDELVSLAKKIEEEIRRKQSDAAYVGGIMTWPAPGYTRITSSFGYRIHPILKTRKLHTGIDIGVPSNSTIVAAQSGTVIASGYNGGYGKIVMIDHGGGIVTLYAHNNTLLVKEGDRVEKGQPITKSGSTGLSTGPHLHFEVRENGKYVDPIPWVRGN